MAGRRVPTPPERQLPNEIDKRASPMFISPAYAQGAPAGDPFGGLGVLFPMILMLIIFYFLLIRPQQQRAKQHQEMISKVRRGDTVVTSSGFIGRVTKVPDGADEIEVELAETLKIRVLKSTLMDVRAKGEPVKDAG
jgi:preprotein translocase subunit YajC